MVIYPAIDLLDGKCVRLKKGDFDQKTIYSDNPEHMLKIFEVDGAVALHLVDLSGAKDPQKRQLTLIRSLVKDSSLKIQSGGGIRTLDDVRSLLDCGVERVVVGSIAASNPELVKQMLKEFGPSKLTLAIDVAPKDGKYFVAVNGWKTVTDIEASTLLQGYQDSVDLCTQGARVLCTDISLDGMMVGPNVKLYEELIQKFPGIDFQASGGITRPEDLDELEKVGVRSLVIGKAIYEGTISLARELEKRKGGSSC